MSALRSLGTVRSAASRLAACRSIAQSLRAPQASAAVSSYTDQFLSSPVSSLFGSAALLHSGSKWQRAFATSPVEPNPLGCTNTSSGVGGNPLATAQDSARKPNPLAASTTVNVGSSGKPDPLAATTSVSTGSSTKPNPLDATTNTVSADSAKPDPLASSTNVTADRSGAATSTYSFQQSTYDGPPKLVVFGGNGFVGTRVCEEALQTGLAVVSINRSGAPKTTAPWTSDVEWISGDAFEPDQWRDQLQGAVGVVSCLGGFGSNEFMLKICGQANVGVIREAAQAGVPRCAFISVHEFHFPGFVLSGYFQGKRNAEHAMAEAYPDQGVCLRPGFIHGTRYVSGVGIPLSLIGVPLEKALGFLPAKSLANLPLAGAAFVPPTSVQAVAKAAVAAATDPAVPGGIMDVWQLQQYENQ